MATMRPLKIAAALIIVSSASLMWARAGQVVYVANQPTVNVGNTVPVNVQNTTAVQSQVVAALKSDIQALSGDITNDTGVITRVITNTADVQNAAQANYGIDTVRVAALQAAQSGAASCNDLMSGAAAAAYAAHTAAWRQKLSDMNGNYFSNAPTVNGAPNPSAVSRQAAYARMNAAVCQGGFAGPGTVATGICGSNPTPSAYPGLTTSYQDLFGVNDWNANQATAAQLYITNAIDPSPLPPIPPAQAQSSAGAAIMAGRRAYAARISAAVSVFSGAEAARQPWTEGPPAFAQWANGEAGNLGGRIVASSSGSYFPNGVSELDYMRVKADGFMFDKKYLEKTSNEGFTSLLRDILIADQYRAWMRWKTYQLDMTRNNLLALSLANSQIPSSTLTNP